jgi:hypothetical protein
MSKKKQMRKTSRSFWYVTGPKHSRNFHIPKGMLCVRTKGEARIDGKTVINPWVLHETPQEYLQNEDFLKYARTYGIIIGEENLEPAPDQKREKFDKELLALCAQEYTGTDDKGDSVPPMVVLKWINGTVCDYWAHYTPARALAQWVEQYQFESDNEEEFAAQCLEDFHWELYKQLDESAFGLACFDFLRYWSGTLRFDYSYIEHEGRKFFYSTNWE